MTGACVCVRVCICVCWTTDRLPIQSHVHSHTSQIHIHIAVHTFDCSRAKALQQLHNLLDVKDSRVFDRLSLLCNPLAEEVSLIAKQKQHLSVCHLSL